MADLHAFWSQLGPLDLILLALCGLLVGVGWLLLRPTLSVRERETFVRLDTRLEDQARRLDGVDQRLDDVIARQVETAGDLRGEFIERFERLHHGVAENLADGRTQSTRSLVELREELRAHLADHRTRFE